MHIAAFFPILFKPSPKPTVVVVFPSPAGVGFIAVTRIKLPSSLPLNPFINSSDTFALSCPKGSNSEYGMFSFSPIA